MQTLKDIIQSTNSSKRTLFILCGLPYSGKTYLANKIIKETNCVYVSIDNILKDLGYDWDSNKLPNELGWKQVFDSSYQQAQDALKNDLNVLYDSTNHTKISRDTLRQTANALNANTKVIYLNVPIETIWKRWEDNNRTKDRSIIDKKLVEMTIESFEIPTIEEHLLIIEN